MRKVIVRVVVLVCFIVVCVIVILVGGKIEFVTNIKVCDGGSATATTAGNVVVAAVVAAVVCVCVVGKRFSKHISGKYVCIYGRVYV